MTSILAYKNVAHVQMCGKTGKMGGSPYGRRENRGKEADPQNNRKGVGRFFCPIFADFLAVEWSGITREGHG